MIVQLIRQAAILLGIAALPALVSGAIQLTWRHQEPLAADEVLPKTAESWGDTALFVDARPRARFNEKHIPGALLLNLDEWDGLVGKFLDAWDPDKKIVVYCDGGGCDAARDVASRMGKDLQLKNVYVLKGGWPAWESR